MSDRAGRITLTDLVQMKRAGRKFAMLTAYDFPTAAAAQAAGVHSLLVGDSMGCVLLGHPNTRGVPLDLMVTLAEAVRRGAPRVYLVGDMPYRSMLAGRDGVLNAAERFRDEAGCDAVKVECAAGDAPLVATLAAQGFEVIAHIGLRPQAVEDAADYRAQARDPDAIEALAQDARELAHAGAAMLLLEAVPGEASAAVLAAVDLPVIGCGAGPACDGHVVVTQDMLGTSASPPPRFVPVLGHLGEHTAAAMRRYVEDVTTGRYPAPQHVYPMRRATPAPAGDRGR